MKKIRHISWETIRMMAESRYLFRFSMIISFVILHSSITPSSGRYRRSTIIVPICRCYRGSNERTKHENAGSQSLYSKILLKMITCRVLFTFKNVLYSYFLPKNYRFVPVFKNRQRPRDDVRHRPVSRGGRRSWYFSRRRGSEHKFWTL